jgi:Tfp pilus assembly protein PilF
MKRSQTCLCSAAFLFWVAGCASGPGKAAPAGELIDAKLEFGRRAAQFQLWNEAIFRWEQVLAADPENAKATNNLAVAFESVGHYERALDLYKKALELDEDSETIRKNYKRFMNFYKKHQRQIERQRQKEPPVENPEDAAQEPAANSEEGSHP